MIDIKDIFLMNVNDDTSYAFKIYNLLEAMSLFHFFNESLPSSLSTYQKIKNIMFKKMNINFYR